jgi:hypothetical protein
MLNRPRKLVEDWKEENPGQSASDQLVAANIAVFALPNDPEYNFDEPNWLRHAVTNTRACDHHDNGIRAWVVKFSDSPEMIEKPAEAKHQ